jgi:hypothetical protein
MLGFKRFRSAATTISRIELMHRIREGQFDLATLGLKDTAAATGRDVVLFSRHLAEGTPRWKVNRQGDLDRPAGASLS